MQQQNKRVSKIADIGELDRRITLMKKKYVGENPNTGMSMYKDVRLGKSFCPTRSGILHSGHGEIGKTTVIHHPIP